MRHSLHIGTEAVRPRDVGATAAFSDEDPAHHGQDGSRK